MFERLDAQARQIFELAQRAARALDHNYVGTEHLLAALAIHGGVLAACSLASAAVPTRSEPRSCR